MTRDQILDAARELPVDEQRALANELLDAAATDPEIDALWIAEAVRRREEVHTGTVKGVPAEAVFARWSAARSPPEARARILGEAAVILTGEGA